MEQKIIQVGNSLGVILPASLLKAKKLKAGSKVRIKDTTDTIIIEPEKAEMGGVDVSFMKMVDSFIHDHEDVLKELSKR